MGNKGSRKNASSARQTPTKIERGDRTPVVNSTLAAELEEALQLQAATANILKMIAASPTAVEPVLRAIVESASELCGDCDASVFLRAGDDLHFSAHHGPIPTSLGKRPVNRNWVAGRSVVDRIPVQVADFLAAAATEFPEGQELGRLFGHRCALSVPLLREGEAIGALALRRLEAGPFSEQQIALLQTFADQAVIAIENVRLFEQAQAKARDLEESLMQQTATADVLKVINRSTFDLQTVLSSLVETVARFCKADFVLIHRRETERYRCVATFGLPPEYKDYIKTHTFPVDRGTVFGRAVMERKIVEVEDLAADPEYLVRKNIALGKGRTVMAAPLLREGSPIGAIVVARHESRRFTQRQIELVATFADQAAIAIENVRLFEQAQTKTRDLEDSLMQQTATADVLKVINRSAFDLQPVLGALVEKAVQFCHADYALILRREADRYRAVATFGLTPDYESYIRAHTFAADRGTVFGRAVLDRKVVEVEDIATDPGYQVKQTVILGNGHSALGAPLLREGKPIGAIAVARRVVRPFTERQIELVATFADQAAIAMENTRLMVEQRDRHLALEQEVRRRMTELERAQEALMSAQQELARANRIATAGALSTSIAHDLNQPLGAVIMDTQACLRWLQRDPPDLPAAIAAADRSVRNSVRASEIVKHTRERLMKGRRQVAKIDIEQLVRGTITLLEREIVAHRASVSCGFVRPDLYVNADRTELQQVLVNLVLNALHSMSSSDRAERLLFVDVKTPIAGRIEMAIRDTGIGISSESMPRLFEPFFTTKIGGMGMGLSICQATVQAWGGCLRAENHPAGGAVFTFDLPIGGQDQEV